MTDIGSHELALLFKFYQRAQHFSGGGIYGDSLIDHIAFADEMRASLLLGRLKSAGYVEKRGAGSENRVVYGVTTDGEAYIEQLLVDNPAAIDGAIALLDEGAVRPAPEPTSGEIESGEPEWSPLPIERDNPDFRTALTNLEAATAAIEADNGYAATEPVERSNVVARLRGALDLMRSAPALTASAIQVHIVWPMEKIARRFTARSIVGTAAKLAWDTFRDWVKKAGGELLDNLFS